MAGRWSIAQVDALAPDEAAWRAGAGLSGPAPWSGTGAHGLLVWGRCRGSGATPYQVIVDLGAPAYKCSCPSRKFPCKHALALLRRWAVDDVPEADEPADYAAAWQASRAARAPARPKGPRDEQAAAKRAEARADRVAAGLDELDRWLRDQVRTGLSATATGGYRHFEQPAARMVDAQAPGVAGTLRRLAAVPAGGDGWPGRLLAEYGQLRLLVDAHRRLAELPPELAATVRAHVGYPVTREEVLKRPPVSDAWVVLGARDQLDAAVPSRRIWLQGLQSGRAALLLVFDPGGQFGRGDDVGLAPGALLIADLCFYPGRPELRAAVATRHEVIAGPPPSPTVNGVDAALDGFAAALAADPWLRDWPVVLVGAAQRDGAGWQLADLGGRAVPLLIGEPAAWTLAAVSGGHPVLVAGEWTASGLRPLTVWHEQTAVDLGAAP